MTAKNLEELGFLAALTADAEGRRKLISAESDVADGDVGNQFRGERRLMAATLLSTMGDPDRTAALAFLAKRVGYRLERDSRSPDEIRSEAIRVVRAMGEQLAVALDQLGEADRREALLEASTIYRVPAAAEREQGRGAA